MKARLYVVAAVMGAGMACSTFADDTRLTPEDASALLDASSAAKDAGAATDVEPSGACTLTADPAAGAAGCGGAGGVGGIPGTSVTAGRAVALHEIVCGSSKAAPLTFTYSPASGASCFVITVTGNGGTVHVTGSGVDETAPLTGAVNVPLNTPATMTIEIANAEAFALTIR